MKKLSRKRKRLLIISGGVLLLLVLVILTVRGVHHLTSPRVDTEQGIQHIKAAESEDTAIIEQKIAQLENIQPTDEDLNAEYEKIAQNYGMEADKVKSFIPKEDLAKDVAVEKAMEIVRSNAAITEAAE